MKVLPAQQAAEAAAAQATKRTDKASTAAFKSALAKASTTTETTEKSAEITLRKGEEAVAVEGHAYSEITKGDRDGMYVNTSGNVRHGETFVLVRKNGKEYHVYGSGKDRLVVGFHMPGTEKTEATGTGTTPTTTTKTDEKKTVDSSDLKLRKGEKIEPVEGHAYAEITSGAREGMYINTSGNDRHGEAFVLVNKLGIEYHIYGSGADRTVVALDRKKRDDE